MRKKQYVGQEWVFRDVRLMLAFVLLLALAGVNPVFFWGVLAVALYAGFLVARYYLRRHRAEQRNADAPFWVDDLRSPRG